MFFYDLFISLINKALVYGFIAWKRSFTQTLRYITLLTPVFWFFICFIADIIGN